ncbi:MAG: cobalt-zinc-cadmium efflux system protein [Frankiaceae bacterium]|nr:cobalt-zinc-cadmium efflux system protein [Frankiaceae bacterium]
MSQRRRLTIVLALNVTMIVGLLVVGLISHSLGVVAADGDYIADSTAILLGIVAVTVRDRRGQDSQAPTYVALINSGGLLAVSVFVLVEAVRRLVDGTPAIRGLPVLVVSSIAAAVMVVGVVVLGRDAGREDLHMRSVLLDTAADALAAAGVAVSGGIIFVTGRLFWLDSALSLVISVVIGVGAIRLLGDVVRALRTHTPLVLDDE